MWAIVRIRKSGVGEKKVLLTYNNIIYNIRIGLLNENTRFTATLSFVLTHSSGRFNEEKTYQPVIHLYKGEQ